MSCLYGGREIRDDQINWKPSLVYPSTIIEQKKDYIDPDVIKNLMEAEILAKQKQEEENKLHLNPEITDQERRLRRLYSAKPDFCGSCKSEMRFDDEKYCHVCKRDPFYNPQNMPIGGEGKCIQDYDLLKEKNLNRFTLALSHSLISSKDWSEFMSYKESKK